MRMSVNVTGVLMALAIVAVAPPAGAHPQDDELASPALRISWDDFKKIYDAGNVVVIDTRDRASFEAGHIPGARSLPLADVEKSIPRLRRLTKPIVFYCA